MQLVIRLPPGLMMGGIGLLNHHLARSASASAGNNVHMAVRMPILQLAFQNCCDGAVCDVCDRLLCIFAVQEAREEDGVGGADLNR
jgi:hypothetical protein